MVFGLGPDRGRIAVGDFWKKDLPPWAMALMLGICFPFMAWLHLFPLSSHPDLRFQATGELIADAIAIGMLSVQSLRMKDFRTRSIAGQLRLENRLIGGFGFAAVLLAVNWRDFFSGERFQFQARIRTIVGVCVATAFFMAFGFNTPRVKPSKQEEKSVV